MLAVRWSRSLGVAVVAAGVFSTTSAGAQECAEGDEWNVALGASLGAGIGAGASLGVAGALTADEGRDFSFAAGALAGIGVTVGLSTIYGLYDGFTGCRMAGGGIAWSVPITMLVLGSLLPVAVWGASGEASTEAPVVAAPAMEPASVGWSIRF